MLLSELCPERLAAENEILRKEPVNFDAAATLAGAVVQQRIRDLIAIQMGKSGTGYLSPLPPPVRPLSDHLACRQKRGPITVPATAMVEGRDNMDVFLPRPRKRLWPILS